MYAYRPNFEKKKEKLLSLALAIFGAVLYGSSQIPNAPFPGLIQIIGVGSFAGAVLVICMCVMRRYDYVLEENEKGTIDFIITEYYARRQMIVCRVALNDVSSVSLYTRELKDAILKEKHKVYSYTSVLFDENRFILEMNSHGEHFYVIVCADETLSNILSHHCQQYLSDIS